MGQLLEKFKKWREKRVFSHEKSKLYASPQYTSLNGEGITRESDDLSVKELFKRLEMLECLMENQQKFLGDHDAKIQEIESAITRILADKEEKRNQTKAGDEKQTFLHKVNEYEELLKKNNESYEKLKKEVENQLQIQQKLRDNLLAGFIVGFVIMVMICMLPRTLLASG